MRGNRERIEELGANVVLIGLGSPGQAKVFCRQQDVPFACLVSPDRAAHRAFGLRRGTANQVAGPRVWLPWLRNVAAGRRQTAWRGQGDIATLPGTYVVDSDGVIRYAYRGQRSSDLAPEFEVLAALEEIRAKEEMG